MNAWSKSFWDNRSKQWFQSCGPQVKRVAHPLFLCCCPLFLTAEILVTIILCKTSVLLLMFALGWPYIWFLSHSRVRAWYHKCVRSQIHSSISSKYSFYALLVWCHATVTSGYIHICCAITDPFWWVCKITWSLNTSTSLVNWKVDSTFGRVAGSDPMVIFCSLWWNVIIHLTHPRLWQNGGPVCWVCYFCESIAKESAFQNCNSHPAGSECIGV